MKLRHAWIAAALAGAASAQQSPPPASAPAGQVFEVGGIAATVNGKIITKTELAFEAGPLYAQLAAEFPHGGPEFEKRAIEVRSKILEAMIDQKIILSEFSTLARNNGAKIPDHMIDDEIRRQMRENYGGDEERFREALKKSGINEDRFRGMVRDQLVVQAIRGEHISEAPPPLPAELSKKYAEVKDQLRDMSQDRIDFQKIFLPHNDSLTAGSTPASQLELADRLAADLRRGGDFAEAAKKYSRDAFASEGGLAKNQSRTKDLSPAFSSIVFGAKEGDLIGPLGDAYGYTIVKVIKIYPGPSPSFDQVRDKIESIIRREKTSAGYEKWIADKRKAALIKRNI